MLKRSLSKNRTKLEVNKSTQGETIEEKCRRIENNKEPITDGAPIIWTPRHEGVLPQYDIRTDRFEVAIDAMDTVQKSTRAKRENFYKSEENQSQGSESIQGTES